MPKSLLTRAQLKQLADFRNDDADALDLGMANNLLLRYVPGATTAEIPEIDQPGSNTFSTFGPLMAACDSAKSLGRRTIQLVSAYEEPAIIPAGTWNVTDVKWFAQPHQGVTRVEIASGASFVVDDPPEATADNFRGLEIEGYGLVILYNGTGDTTPFDGVDICVGGNNVRFANSEPTAKPMFRAQDFTLLLFNGACVNGGLQNYFPDQELAAPLVDCNGGIFLIFGGGGVVRNGFATDLSVGGGGIVFGITYPGFYGDFYDQWSAPDLVAAGGAVFMDEIRDVSRYRVNPRFAGIPVVPPQEGTGDSITVSDGVATLTDAATTFAPQGRYITIAGSTTPANDGTFLIVGWDGNTVSYENEDAVAEAYTGAWAISDYEAAYNEYVPVDTATGAVTVKLPNAVGSFGERVTVKDKGAAGTNNITVESDYDNNTVESGTISTNSQSKTWVSDGAGSWDYLKP